MNLREQKAHHEAELRRIQAELDAEKGLVEGDFCWKSLPNGDVHDDGRYSPGLAVPCFPCTDDGKRKAERAAKMMQSLNFEDPPFEEGQEVWIVWPDGNITPWTCDENDHDGNYWHQGRIHATEAEALAWRDEFNGAWGRK